MTVQLYVWKEPRVSDPEAAAELVRAWTDEGGAAAGRPFEASNDVHWFFNELVKDAPDVEATIDETHEHGTEKWWWAHEPGPTDRLAVVTLTEATHPSVVSDIFSMAAKYDLVIYDPANGRVHLPLEEMTAYAEATFWPSGAIQAAVAGLIGGGLAIAAWIVSIPILSGIVVVVGGFMAVMAIYTFVHEGRKRLRSRGGERG
jgi:hypothetical protein